MRGFDAGGIGPRECSNRVCSTSNNDALGGENFAVARFEAEFPLGIPDEYGLSGGLFYDIGNCLVKIKGRFNFLIATTYFTLRFTFFIILVILIIMLSFYWLISFQFVGLIRLILLSFKLRIEIRFFNLYIVYIALCFCLMFLCSIIN